LNGTRTTPPELEVINAAKLEIFHDFQIKIGEHTIFCYRLLFLHSASQTYNRSYKSISSCCQPHFWLIVYLIYSNPLSPFHLHFELTLAMMFHLFTFSFLLMSLTANIRSVDAACLPCQRRSSGDFWSELVIRTVWSPHITEPSEETTWKVGHRVKIKWYAWSPSLPLLFHTN
jgi:hypothetical protein